MENIYDLEEFSNDKDNSDESKEKNGFEFQNNSNNKHPSNIDLSLQKAFSAEKPQISENNCLSEINSDLKIISNNSLDPSKLLYDENICHNINKNFDISPFPSEIQKKN